MIHCLNCARVEGLLKKVRAKLCSLKVNQNIKAKKAGADQMVQVLYLCARYAYERRPNILKGIPTPWDDLPQDRQDEWVQDLIRFVKEKG